MAIFILILIACVVSGLNFSRTKQKNYPLPTGEVEIFTEPVAKTYAILYWSAAVHIVDDVVTVAWQFAYTHPWERFTPQYITYHHLHNTVHFLVRQNELIILIEAAIFISLSIYTVLSKKIHSIITILLIIAGWDFLSIVVDFTASPYRLIYNLVWAAFSSLVAWSLIMREPNFLKIFRLEQ